MAEQWYILRDSQRHGPYSGADLKKYAASGHLLSIVRRMEREQAGISDDEMRQLSEQLREAEAKTDAAPRPITPLDVNAALEGALKGKKTSPRERR